MRPSAKNNDAKRKSGKIRGSLFQLAKHSKRKERSVSLALTPDERYVVASVGGNQYGQQRTRFVPNFRDRIGTPKTFLSRNKVGDTQGRTPAWAILSVETE